MRGNIELSPEDQAKLNKARECKNCGGNGEVTTMESVYPNEPYQAPVGSEVCENCLGSGLEPDQEIVEERIKELTS